MGGEGENVTTAYICGLGFAHWLKAVNTHSAQDWEEQQVSDEVSRTFTSWLRNLNSEPWSGGL